MARGQRSSLVSLLLLGAAGWLLLSHVAPTFVGVRPAAKGRTAMNGLSEEFAEWRASLSPEEKKAMTDGAQLAMDKKYLKTLPEEFTEVEGLSEEKDKKFMSILSKFINASGGLDAKKGMGKVRPDYNAMVDLMGDGSDQETLLALTNEVHEIDRHAERRYQYAIGRNDVLKYRDGKAGLISCSPQMEETFFNESNDPLKDPAKFAETLKKVEEYVAGADWSNGISKEDAEKGIAALKERVAAGKHSLILPVAVREIMDKQMEKALNVTMAFDKEGTSKETMKMAIAQAMFEEWYAANEEVETAALSYEAVYKSIDKETKKSKGDVLKEMWAAMAEKGYEMPALDEEFVAEMSQVPAAVDWVSPWATADKLYKSEAVDKFGERFLLGIYETKEEAIERFDLWNQEYMKAFADRKEMFSSKDKVAEAEAKKDTAAKDRILAILEEAQANQGYM